MFSKPDVLVKDVPNEIYESKGEAERTARLLKAISHPMRLKIVYALAETEASVQEIVESLGTTQSNISQHLGILRDKEVLAHRKEANRVFYRVKDTRTLELLDMINNIFFQTT